MLRLKPIINMPLKRFNSTTTQDQKQLELFNKLGGSWWHDPGLKSLRDINRVRIPIFKDFIVPVHGNCKYAHTHMAMKGVKILDVGCGGGFLSEALAKLGANVVALDTAQDAIQAAKDHASLDPNLTENLSYDILPVEEWAKTHKGEYDVVVSSEVIEHVNEPEYFLSNCLACLRTGGSMILTTMSQNWLSGFSNIFVCENITGVIPKGAHEYSKFIHPKKMQEMLLAQKCSTIDIKGFWINCYTAESHHMPVDWFNYAIHAVKH